MRADRLLSIVMILMEKKQISASSLSKMLEVSTRTIYRDVETLSMAGIPIYTTTGVKGGIGILESYKVDKQLLNLNDITALLIGLNSIDNVYSNKTLMDLNLKIRNLLNEKHHNQLETRIKQIKIDHSEKKVLDLNDLFEEIKQAMDQKVIMKFTYKDRLGTVTHRKVEPYRLLYKNKEWYLQGFCKDRLDFRTFKLNRISEAELLNETYIDREVPLDTLDHMEFKDEDIQQVTLRVADKKIEPFISQYGQQCILSADQNHYIIQIPMSINEWACQYILSFGDSCECLAPAELRNAILTMINSIRKYYEPENDC